MSLHMEHNQTSLVDTHAAVRDHLFAHMDIRGWR